MSTIPVDSTSAAAALGWLATYLVHSTLWLAGTWCFARCVRSPSWRDRLWRGAALGGFASVALLAAWPEARPAWNFAMAPMALENLGEGAPIVLSVDGSDVGNATTGHAARAQYASPSGWALNWPSALLAAWLVGATLALAHLAFQYRQLARLLAGRAPLTEGPVVAELARLRDGGSPAARLSVSRDLPSPVVLARGEIVLPERALALAPARREALLAHELAHLERRDSWWLLALSVLERALFVQPLNRLARARSSAAAELACDERAAARTGGGLELARCLAEVAGWRTPNERLAAVGLAQRPSALVERVERLLEPSRPARRQGLIVGAWLAGGLTALAYAGPRVAPAGGGQEPEIQARIVSGASIPPPAEPALRRRLEALGGPDFAGGMSQSKNDARITAAIDVLDDCPEADIAFHVPWNGDGYAARPMYAQEHAFRLRSDGSAWCGNMRMMQLGVEDERLLRWHIDEIARIMPKAPLDARRPGGPQVPSGRLRLLIDQRAPHGLVQTVLELCGRRQARIWQFDLVLVGPDGPGEPLRFALPTDIGAEHGSPGAIPEMVHEDLDEPEEGQTDPAALLTRSLKIDLRVLSTESGMRLTETTSRYPVAFAGRRGEAEPVYESITTTSSQSLQRFLAQAYAAGPERSVVIDARPGVLYADVVALMDTIVEAGFTNIRFTGRRR